MSSEELGNQEVIDSVYNLVIAKQAPPANIHFCHMTRNRQVKVETDNIESGAVSDLIIDAVFELVALDDPAVITILEGHGFTWDTKEDVDRG